MRGLQVVAGYLITGAASAGVTCLFVLAVVLFYQLADTGGAADWIASVANAVMAITAVFAFIVARSWRPQLTTQEGYKLAIELVNEHYKWLGAQNTLLPEAGRAMAYIRHLQDGETMKGSAVSYEGAMTSLDATLREHKIRRDTMIQIRNNLDTYGLHDAPSVRARFEALDGAYQKACDATATLRGILFKMKEAQQLIPDYRPSSGMFYQQPVDEMLRNALWMDEETYKIVEKEFNKMVATHTALLGAPPPIGKLFKVKR